MGRDAGLQTGFGTSSGNAGEVSDRLRTPTLAIPLHDQISLQAEQQGLTREGLKLRRPLLQHFGLAQRDAAA